MPDTVTLDTGHLLLYVFMALNFPVFYLAGGLRDADVESLEHRGASTIVYLLGGFMLSFVQTVVAVELFANGFVAVAVIEAVTFGLAFWIMDRDHNRKVREKRESEIRSRELAREYYEEQKRQEREQGDG